MAVIDPGHAAYEEIALPGNEPRAVSAQPVTTLRGAGVEVDARRAARVVGALVLVGLIVTSALLFGAGATKNAQITALRTDGVPVTVTVSKCLGLLGGSGSNGAGYACRGTYSFDGKRYSEAIPGNIDRPPRSTVAAIVARSDPALVSTAADVKSEHASVRVFVAPAILALIALIALGALGFRRRAARSARTRSVASA